MANTPPDDFKARPGARAPKLHRIGARFPKSVLLLAVCVTLVSVLAARDLRVESDLVSFLPPQLESVRNLGQLKEGFGGSGFVLIVAEGATPEQTVRFADRLAGAFEVHPAVRYVDYRKPADYFLRRQWLYLDRSDLSEVERRVDRALDSGRKGLSPVFDDLMDFADPEDRVGLKLDDIAEKYRGKYGVDLRSSVLASDDGRTVVLRVKTRGNAQAFGTTEKMLADFRRIADEIAAAPGFREVRVGFTGTSPKMAEQASLIRNEIAGVSLLVTAVLTLVLLVYFRSVRAVLLVGLPVCAAILWTGGVTAVLLGRLNLITSFAAVILAGLGSDYAIYILTHYVRLRREGFSPGQAREEALSQTGFATYLSMLTTAAGFLALLFSRFDLFYEFGVVGVVGLVLNYLAIMLLMPALLVLMERHGWRSSRTDAGFLSRAVRSAAERFWGRAYRAFVPSAPVVWVAALGILIALSSGSVRTVARITFDDGQIESRDLPSYKLADRIAPLFRQSGNPTVLLVRGAEKERETVRVLEDYLEARPKGGVFNQVVGLSSFLPDDVEGKKEILRKIRSKAALLPSSHLPSRNDFLKSLDDSLAAAAPDRGSLPEEVRRQFVSENDPALHAVYLNPSFARANDETMRRYHEGIQSLKRETGLSFEAADNTFISDEIVKLVQRKAPWGFLLFALFLSALLLLRVKPLRRAVLICLSLFASLVLLSAVLWLFRVKLNIINIAVLPVIVGTAVDSFIHLSQALMEKTFPDRVIREELPPIFVSNLTSMIGFGGLLWTSSAALREAGFIAVAGIGAVTVVCVLFFPKCLALLGLGGDVEAGEEAESEPVEA